jgi:hypothetical protein
MLKKIIVGKAYHYVGKRVFERTLVVRSRSLAERKFD